MPRFLPICSCAESRAAEERFFAGDAAAAVAVMRRAGKAVARHALAAFGEAGDRGRHAWIFFGKGANGADALFAARHLAESGLRCHLVPAFDRRHWAHAVRLAHDELLRDHPETVAHADPARLTAESARPLVLDGLTGSGFRPPLSPVLRALIGGLNAARAFVVAVDLPSGAGDASDALLVRADLTVATGMVKRPLLTDERVRASAGRIRCADPGFFDGCAEGVAAVEAVADMSILEPLRAPLNAGSDKRAHGHVALFGGAPTMPGALLLNTLAAVRAGAGLVTAYAPASVHAAFAAAAPEAMWVAAPEGDGGVRWEKCLRAFGKTSPRFGAVVCGSGMGDAPAVAALARTLVREYPGRLVLDADALRPAVLAALADRPPAFGPVVLTPHAGEFRRITGADASWEALRAYAEASGAIVVLKGPATRVAVSGRVVMIPFGGPALARGGSGDLLAGMLGARLAQEAGDPVETVCRTVAWHGHAADRIAARDGALTLRTSEILDALGPCLRDGSC